MSLTYGFYNSNNGDRRYNAEQMASIFDGIVNDGIYESIGDRFEVKPALGNEITIGTGRAWFNHTWTLNDTLYNIELPQSDVINDRYDVVVLEVDSTINVRANSFKIISGAAEENPVIPELIDTEDVHQHPIAYIYRHANSTGVTPMDITPVVGTSACPFVTGILQVTDVDYLYSQWEFMFREWFANLKVVLDGDVATHLQHEIEQVQDNVDQTLIEYSQQLDTRLGDQVTYELRNNNKDLYIFRKQ